MDWYPPSPTHCTSGLLHVFLVSENGDVFFTVFVKMCEHLMFSLIWENTEKTRMQSHLDKSSNFVLNLYLNAVGD